MTIGDRDEPITGVLDATAPARPSAPLLASGALTPDGWRRLVEGISGDHAILLDPQFRVAWETQPPFHPVTRQRRGADAAVIEAFHPDDLASLVMQADKAHSNPGVPVPVEFRLLDADGRPVPYAGWITSVSVPEPGSLLARVRRAGADEQQPQASDAFILLANNAPIGFVGISQEGQVAYVNPRFSELLPGDRPEFVHDILRLATAESRPGLQAALDAAVAGHAVDTTFTTALPGQRVRRLRIVSAGSDHLPKDSLFGGTLALLDVSGEIEHQVALHSVLEVYPHAVMVFDPEGRFVLANRTATELILGGPGELAGSLVEDVIPAGIAARIRAANDEVLASGRATGFCEERHRDLKGAPMVYRTARIPFVAPDSGRPCVLVISMDVSNEVLSEERLRSVHRHMLDLTMIVDEAGCRHFVSASSSPLLGYDPDTLTRMTDAELLHPEDVCLMDAFIADLRDSAGREGRIEVRYRHADGRYRWFEIRCVNLADIPSIDGLLLFARDIDDRKEAEQRLRYEAGHDPLTGVLNRRATLRALDAVLADAQRTSGGVGVLFCDLDNFKLVNDSLGHEAGDSVLRLLAGSLDDALPAHAVLGRFGGDEFVVLVPEVDGVDELIVLGDRLVRTVTDAVRQSPFPVGLSVGVSFSADASTDSEELVKNADAALYRAKESGRARVAVYDESLRERSRHDLRIGRLLRDVLDAGSLEAHYQPVFSMHPQSGRLEPVALEALARCPLPDGSWLSPAEFIPVAERTGLIAALGDRMVDLAVDALAEWVGTYSGVQVWINVSVLQLQRNGFARSVLARLEGRGLAPERLGIEVTESVLGVSDPAILEELRQLRGAGCWIIVDDFGTGYSALSALKRYPVDVVKVDREFTHGVVDGGVDQAIIEAVVALSRALGTGLVAEGIETPEQAATLLSMGCDALQGFHLARPADRGTTSARLVEWVGTGLPVPDAPTPATLGTSRG